MTNIAPWLARLLALSILLALVFACWSLVVEPIARQARDNKASISDTAALLARYRGIAAMRKQIEDSLRAAEVTPPAEANLLPGTNPDLAAAELQRQVKRAVQSSGGVLESITILQPENDEHFRKIGLSFSMDSEIPGLQRILYSLESADPYLYVGDLDVRMRSPGLSKAPKSGPVRLQVRLDVYGFMDAPAQ